MLALNAQQDDLKNVENDSFSNSSDDHNESDDNGSDVIEKPHMVTNVTILDIVHILTLDMAQKL